mmetsp:Transcript_23403/g.54448  ORF Transcript_23403/g.54448 Transcript_23403/m.54448 type:complete len:610 (+) Transcript_23403:85-1914(+)
MQKSSSLSAIYGTDCGLAAIKSRDTRPRSASAGETTRPKSGGFVDRLRSSQKRLYLSGSGEEGRWSRPTGDRRRALSPQQWGTVKHPSRRLRLGPREDQLKRCASTPAVAVLESSKVKNKAGLILDWAAIEVRAAARRVLERPPRNPPTRGTASSLPDMTQAFSLPQLARSLLEAPTLPRPRAAISREMQEAQAAELLLRAIAAVPVATPSRRLSVREMANTRHLTLSSRLSSQILSDVGSPARKHCDSTARQTIAPTEVELGEGGAKEPRPVVLAASDAAEPIRSSEAAAKLQRHSQPMVAAPYAHAPQLVSFAEGGNADLEPNVSRTPVKRDSRRATAGRSWSPNGAGRSGGKKGSPQKHSPHRRRAASATPAPSTSPIKSSEAQRLWLDAMACSSVRACAPGRTLGPCKAVGSGCVASHLQSSIGLLEDGDAQAINSSPARDAKVAPKETLPSAIPSATALAQTSAGALAGKSSCKEPESQHAARSRTPLTDEDLASMVLDVRAAATLQVLLGTQPGSNTPTSQGGESTVCNLKLVEPPYRKAASEASLGDGSSEISAAALQLKVVAAGAHVATCGAHEAGRSLYEQFLEGYRRHLHVSVEDAKVR